MGAFIIESVDHGNVDDVIITQIAHVLTYEVPQSFETCKDNLNEWFYDEIPGEKMTIIATIDDEIVGIVRFWKTPYYQDKWLIEGLKVMRTTRRQGIATKMIQYGITQFREKTSDDLFVNIANYNIASQKLHQKLNFIKCMNGGVNSLGHACDYIEHYQYNG
ncbi:MAG: GNAT family N-acetyltransferase [Turicibacter sp.]